MSELDTFLLQADPDLLTRLGATWDPDGRVYRLPNGARISFSDWTSGSMYSAADLTTVAENAECRLFEYGKSQLLPGSSTACATDLHTNVPRAGYVGLPQGFEGLVFGLTARTSVAPALQEYLDAWIDTAVIHFSYNYKVVFHAPLRKLFTDERQTIDRATAGVAINVNQEDQPTSLRSATMEGMLPIHLRENLSYYAEIKSTSEKTAFQLVEAIRRQQAPSREIHEACVRLRVASAASSTTQSRLIDEAIELIVPTKPLLLWVDLLGFWKRPII